MRRAGVGLVVLAVVGVVTVLGLAGPSSAMAGDAWCPQGAPKAEQFKGSRLKGCVTSAPRSSQKTTAARYGS
jgi:hypothetical protein